MLRNSFQSSINQNNSIVDDDFLRHPTQNPVVGSASLSGRRPDGSSLQSKHVSRVWRRIVYWNEANPRRAGLEPPNLLRTVSQSVNMLSATWDNGRSGPSQHSTSSISIQQLRDFTTKVTNRSITLLPSLDGLTTNVEGFTEFLKSSRTEIYELPCAQTLMNLLSILPAPPCYARSWVWWYRWPIYLCV